jgi:hypothetical protein
MPKRQGLRLKNDGENLGGAPATPHVIPGWPGYYRHDVATPVGGDGEITLEAAKELASDGCRRAGIPGNETNSPTLSTKIMYEPIQSFGPKLGANPMERDDELRNQDEPLSVLSDVYAPPGSSARGCTPTCSDGG